MADKKASPSPAPAPAPAPSPVPAPAPAAAAASKFELAARIPAPTTAKPLYDGFKGAYDRGDTNQTVNYVAHAVTYQGLNVSVIRRELESHNITFQELLVCLTCLAISGNNPDRLTDKAKITDERIARAAYDIIRRVGITGRKTKDNAMLTLSRVGIAYLPLYWKLRVYLHATNRLQEQFPGTIDAVYQDPNMGALAVMHGLEAQYRSYEAQFAEALSGVGDSKKKQTNTDWLMVACRGLQSDVASRQVLGSIMMAGADLTPRELEPFYDEYKSGVFRTAEVPAALPQTRKVAKQAKAESKESA